MEFADARVRGQPPDNRVLPAAATDHKYSHATGSLPGDVRTPLSEC